MVVEHVARTANVSSQEEWLCALFSPLFQMYNCWVSISCTLCLVCIHTYHFYPLYHRTLHVLQTMSSCVVSGKAGWCLVFVLVCCGWAGDEVHTSRGKKIGFYLSQVLFASCVVYQLPSRECLWDWVCTYVQGIYTSSMHCDSTF